MRWDCYKRSSFTQKGDSKWLNQSLLFLVSSFIVIGILGFVPAIAPDGMLLKIFHVNAAHNVVHLATGIVALLCAMSGAGAARTFFQIFGIVYAIVAILGFVKGDDINIWIISNNVADTCLHVVIAVVSLFLGFGTAKQTA
jgi:hypothetical protein